MTDIVEQIPWHCGEHWHLASYWMNEDEFEINEGHPYTYDEFSDGDHEPIESIPSWEEVNKN